MSKKDKLPNVLDITSCRCEGTPEILKVELSKQSNVVATCYRIGCPECYRQGDIAVSEKDAVALWNGRMARKNI